MPLDAWSTSEYNYGMALDASIKIRLDSATLAECERRAEQDNSSVGRIIRQAIRSHLAASTPIVPEEEAS